MLLQFYLNLASLSSLTLRVRAMFFELCVHDGQAPVRRALLSGDSSCLYMYVNELKQYRQNNNAEYII